MVATTIAARFAEVVRAHGARMAVRDGAAEHTYDELDRASSAVAAGLLAHVGEDTCRFGILLPHGTGALTALLGVAKAGGMYVPLDRAWPAAHLRELLTDCAPRAVLTDAEGARFLQADVGFEGVTLIAAELNSERSARALPSRSIEPEDVACVYYSSGSTGKPKGILLTQASVVLDAEQYAHAAAITPADRMAWLSPLAFGASKLPVFGGLLSGACVLPFAVGEHGVHALRTWLESERISVCSCVSTLFRKLADELPQAALPELRVLKLGGEPVLRSDVALFEQKLHAECVLLNGLGITELSGNVCYHRHARGTSIDTPTLPLGHAVDGVQLEIVDDDGMLLPRGAQGEIVVRARHVSPGYLNRPELSAEKFRDFPDGTRAFHTGDIGRLREDGSLIGAGRKDTALKIRGHHVNTAEVDEALLGEPSVAQAATVGRDVAGAFKLVSFVVMREPVVITPTQLRRSIAERLPSYAVPSRIVTLSALPVLPNGKLDRQTLIARPLPEASTGEGRAARNAFEAQLATSWAEVLGLERVSVHDDFFELGGDSLDAAEIFAVFERMLGWSPPVTVLLDHPTIEQLATHLLVQRPGASAPGVVTLTIGDRSAPLFVIPGAGADAFIFRDLAKHLGPSQTLYILRHEDMYARPPMHRTVEAMARRFVEQLRRVQGKGPYYLAGASFGGVVAYEVARQLRAMGEDVALVALFDTFATDYPRLRKRIAWQHWLELARRAWMPVGFSTDRYDAPSLRAALGERARRLIARCVLSVAPDAGLPPRVTQFLYAQEICFRARRRYAFPACDVPVYLFRASRQPPETLYERCDDLGWGRVQTGGLHVAEIPGGHGSIKQEPNVQLLVTKLRAAIESAKQRRRA